MLAWIRRMRDAADLARVLERENNLLRDRLREAAEREENAHHLIRALRDVNADLDRKLQEVTHGAS